MTSALAPASGRAAIRPLVRFAHGSATMTQVIGGGEYENFSMEGAFRLGRNVYRGTVTGYLSLDSSGTSSAFSGADAGHSLSSTCVPLTALPLGFGPVIGEGPPGPAVEALSCEVSIDGSPPAGLNLVFVWTTETQVSCSRCDAFEYTGVFLGLAA